MNRIPIRARITLIVVAVGAAAFLLLGSLLANTIETTTTSNTLQSTSEAFDDVEGLLVIRSDDLVRALQARASDADTNTNTNTNTNTRDEDTLFDELLDDDDLGGPVRWEVLDRSGEPVPLDDVIGVAPNGSVELVGRELCRSLSAGDINCSAEGSFPDTAVGRVMSSAVEQRSEASPSVAIGNLIMWGDVPLIVVAEAGLGASAVSSGLEGVVVNVMIALLVALGALTWIAVGRALRPVDEMTAEVERIDDASLEQRVVVPPANDQLRRLAMTMNGMLARLQSSRDRQRRFVSDASHELRSPITASLATLEVARTSPGDADWERIADVLEEENTRLAHLVDDLLTLARLDERNVPSVSVVDLDELCLAEAARSHPVPVTVQVHRPARVLASGALLARAIRNLVDNAVVYATTEVAIDIDTTGAAHAADAAVAVVRIIDDGPGVPAEQRATIFERFNRIDQSRNRDDGGGAGLGLAIVSEIVSAYGGSVAVEASPSGQGACFIITLPLAESWATTD